MFDAGDVRADRRAATDAERRATRGAAVVWRPVTWVLVAGLALGGCAIPFGNGADSTGRSPEERRRDGSRLYQEEQQRMERERQFDRVGPSER